MALFHSTIFVILSLSASYPLKNSIVLWSYHTPHSYYVLEVFLYPLCFILDGVYCCDLSSTICFCVMLIYALHFVFISDVVLFIFRCLLLYSTQLPDLNLEFTHTECNYNSYFNVLLYQFPYLDQFCSVLIGWFIS